MNESLKQFVYALPWWRLVAVVAAAGLLIYLAGDGLLLLVGAVVYAALVLALAAGVVAFAALSLVAVVAGIAVEVSKHVLALLLPPPVLVVLIVLIVLIVRAARHLRRATR